ncbi:Tad domain-containing protein [Pleionea sp. CnH1-48]|uniref:Tad domain-containing protein n=1 Tax=Pleionea sp. CnH1-48 TaxID=2954494 RepID=UPI0020985FF9|nr:Tad domain-containing protein [Pleionea sp. CnH1-48]MCO7223844.1 Tad domain-containing protein [Pleionea sp. CnH1-48]
MKKQHGYTSVFIILLFAAVALGLFSLYDVGQVTSEKQKIQNTADAVAYSTVNIVTRDMNFIAYTNRAMVTNQVAIGHLVALSSWSHMADITADNYDKLASYIQRIPYIGTIIGSILRAMTAVMKYITDILMMITDNMAKIGIPIQDRIIGVLSWLQTIYHNVAVGKAFQVYKDVAKRNDPKIEEGLAFNGFAVATVVEAFKDEFESYTPSQTARYNRQGRKAQKRFTEFANMVKDSRDRFLPVREYRYWNASLFFVRFHFNKAGGTDFYMKRMRNRQWQWQWTSMDTHSFWFGVRKWSWRRGWYWRDREVVPLGWGAGHALNRNFNTRRGTFNYYWERRADSRQNQWHHNGNYARRHQSSDAWGQAWRNRRAAWGIYRPAWFSGNNRRDIENNLATTQGLRTFRDFKDDTRKDVGPDLVVLMTKKRENIRTMETIEETDANVTRADRFKIEEKGGLPRDRIYALAKAESYYSRPEELGKRSKRWSVKWGRSDRLREYGNLYNPFWQTRLVEPSNRERWITLGTLGLR